MTEDDFKPASRPPQAQEWSVPEDDVYWYEAVVDDAGISRRVPHVNNAEYVRWIDCVAVLAGIRAGSTRERLDREGLLWFVARHEVDYRGETFPGDDIVAATWLSDWTKISVIRHTVFARPGDGRLLCTATTRWVMVDRATRRPTRIPEDLLLRVERPSR